MFRNWKHFHKEQASYNDNKNKSKDVAMSTFPPTPPSTPSSPAWGPHLQCTGSPWVLMFLFSFVPGKEPSLAHWYSSGRVAVHHCAGVKVGVFPVGTGLNVYRR